MSRTWKPLLLIVLAVVAVACAAPETEEIQPAAEPDAEAAAEAEVQDATISDPDHYKVVDENDFFRAVRISYGAGEGSVMHSHPAHVAVFLTDLNSEFQAPDGTIESAQAKAGGHLYLPAGSHKPRITDDQPFEGMALELKAGGGDVHAAEGETGPDPAEVDPERYKVEFENEQVRILRATYGPGEASVPHYHPQHGAVSLDDQNWEMTLPDDSTVQIPSLAGQPILAPAGVHTPRNTGDEAAEVIIVELK
jgi:quercetin dioxygenase-like cupin family protein